MFFTVCVKSVNALHFGDEDGRKSLLFEMSSVYLSDTQFLKPFDCPETAGISARWER